MSHFQNSWKIKLGFINRAGGLYGRILTNVVSTDQTHWGLHTRPRSRFSHKVRLSEQWWAEPNSAKAYSSSLLFLLTRLFATLISEYCENKKVRNVFSLVCNFFTAKQYRPICLSRWENLDRSRYRIQPIKFVNSLVPSPFRHSHIINPILKLTNSIVTWPLNGSEAAGDLVLIQTWLFSFLGKGSFPYGS